MELTTVGTGSSGNAYLLTAGKSILMLDAGMPVRKVNGYVRKWSDIAGCLITHEHQDHAKYWANFADLGVSIYMNKETYTQTANAPEWAINAVKSMMAFQVDEWTVMPFDVEHDAVKPVGYLIRNDRTGETALYATDTYYLRYTFPGVNYWIIECNYDEERLNETEMSRKLTGRLLKSHMSLRRLKDALMANDLSQTRAIVLVHLSDERSDEKKMIREVSSVAGISEVYAAKAGETIQLNINPF